MSQLKRTKSNSGWEDLSSDFDINNITSSKLPKPIRKQAEVKVSTTKHEITEFSKPRRIKQDQSKSLAKLLEACDPKNTSELSVSSRKQNEISNWLRARDVNGVPRILVLSGPSGCGKTVALKLLAKESGFNVIEWITPTDSGLSEHYSSAGQAEKFAEFLVRATRYTSILQSSHDNQSARRLLLVKDIPNIYFINKEAFHDLLTQYLYLGREPLVFICPDNEGSNVLYSLFPPEIIDKFRISTINVYATTAIAMKNMLKRVTPILNLKADEILHVSRSTIDEVLNNSLGDVRSTLLNVIFSSLKVPAQLKSNCAQRGESLGLLHGVGRVINPKRVADGQSWKFVHDPDDIAGYFEAQAMVFLHFLHENYLNTMSNIEHIDRCADIMSLSDTITPEWRDINLIKVNLSLCIRAAMVANETPRNGWNPVRKPKTEKLKLQRDLGVAEERWYRTIICPKPKDQVNLENVITDD